MQYDDICLPPTVESTLDSRSEANTSVEFCGVMLDVPIIASPMPDICNGLMAGTLAQVGAMGIIHRFQTIEEQVEEFKLAKKLASPQITYSGTFGGKTYTNHHYPIGCAIGVKGDYLERVDELYMVGCRIFCLDTANGFNRNVLKAIKNLPDLPNIQVIAGNVATAEGFMYLMQDVDAIRVGIAGGSVCETKTETGVYYPMPLSIKECARIKMGKALLIADGGIKKPEDMAKALALGANVVMCGRIFAGYKETPGEVIKIDGGQKHKLYRGAASYSVQREATGEKPEHNEGNETLVPYVDDSVTKVIKRFKGGLQSAMAYHNCRTLAQFHDTVMVRTLNGNYL